MEHQWIDICRTGHFTDRFGREVELTDEKLDRMIAQYDPAQREAPAVIGHPQINAPAFGWVTALRRDGDRLQAKFRDIVHEFAQGVKQRMWPKRSIKFDEEMNLIHVGFLGAAPPAVPGLAEIQFSEEPEGTEVEFELADYRMPMVANLFRRIRDWFLTQDGVDIEAANEIIPPEVITDLSDQRDEVPDWLVNRLDRIERMMRERTVECRETHQFGGDMDRSGTQVVASQNGGLDKNSRGVTPPCPPQGGNTPSPPVAGSSPPGGMAALERQNNELQRRLDEMEFTAFLESDEIIGRVTPGMREEVMELYRGEYEADALRARSGAELAGNGTDGGSNVERLKNFLKSLPVSVELGEMTELSGRDESASDDDQYRAEGEAIAKSA